MLETETEKAKAPAINDRLRHYVELVNGQPTDTTVCGKPWDQLFVPHNGTICEECIDILRKRGQA